MKLFSVNGNKWLSRLDAAIKVYQNSFEKNLSPFNQPENSSLGSRDDHPLLNRDDVVTQETMVYKFMSGTIIWLDIIAAITLGRSPRLLPHHTSILTSDAETKFEEIMGCENWLMLLISRIAALQEIKIQAMKQEHFDCSELRQNVADISKQIQERVALLNSEMPDVSKIDSTSESPSTLHPSRLVTHIFAYMASIYLHLVLEGFESLETLSTTISEAVRMLQTRIPAQLLPALVAPLFVIGSVAREGGKAFFRDMLSSPPVLNRSLAHRGLILPALESIWIKRQTASFFAWEDSLELTQDILLV